eukprot:TRINITY_DN39012_c0_g1_i1.p1 TRINITY_DN39012_c0_g1~~TRINITY_DN39012_c0_g1_i1.p1  ORF type:complete len:419 (+),score=20.76 TRINITY_DN39012_c0_g1_i1:151-1407(+)
MARADSPPFIFRGAVLVAWLAHAFAVSSNAVGRADAALANVSCMGNRFVRLGYLDTVSVDTLLVSQVSELGTLPRAAVRNMNSWQKDPSVDQVASVDSAWVSEIDALLGIHRVAKEPQFKTRNTDFRNSNARHNERLSVSPLKPVDVKHDPLKGKYSPSSSKRFTAYDAGALDPKPQTGAVGFGQTIARKGLQVVRGPHWAWENQDGGAGSIGIILDISADGLWCTVQWPSGYQNGYRIGDGGRFDLLEAKPVAPRAHKPEQVELKTAAAQSPRRSVRNGGLVAQDVRRGLLVQRGPDWRWADQDGGLGSVGVVIGPERQGWVTVRWPSGVENGYRVGDGGMYDLRLANRGVHMRGTAGTNRVQVQDLALQKAHRSSLHRMPVAGKKGCRTVSQTSHAHMPQMRCWCIDQYGDVLHLP